VENGVQNKFLAETLLGDIVLDSLPYIDDDYQDKEEEINQLIAEEMQKLPQKNYLGSKYPKVELEFKDSAFLAYEYQRTVEKRPHEEGIDNTRYAVAAPPTNKKNDINVWKQALQNAHTQLEHLTLRLANMELLQNYGANAWRSYNAYLENIQKSLANTLAETKQQIELINQRRKEEQGFAGTTLRKLESQWLELIQKNFDIVQACKQLEHDLSILQKEQTNGSNQKK